MLLGRLVQRDESLSISAELVDTYDGSHLWGKRYDRKRADLVAIQEQLGNEIAEQLRLRLKGEQAKALAKRQTRNPEAYHEYLKGLYFWNKQTRPSLQIAIEHFQKAIEKDPAYALAYAGLAQCYAAMGLLSTVPPRESMPKLQAAASRAIQIDDTVAESHIGLADYKMYYEWDWAGAEREFQRALELNPGYAEGHSQYLMYLIAVGRPEEAIVAGTRAQDLDPVSPMLGTNLGFAYYYARKYGDAIEQCRRVLAMDPNFGRARSALGEVYSLNSMHTEAIAELQMAIEQTGGTPPAMSALGTAYARSGAGVAARKVLEKLLGERSHGGYFPAWRIALVYVGLGENDRAFEWLAKAIEERDPGVIFLKTKPDSDPLRSDPRYTNLLRRINLAP